MSSMTILRLLGYVIGESMSTKFRKALTPHKPYNAFKGPAKLKKYFVEVAI